MNQPLPRPTEERQGNDPIRVAEELKIISSVLFDEGRDASVDVIEAAIALLRAPAPPVTTREADGWHDMALAPRTRAIIVKTAAGRILKVKWVIIGDDAQGWGVPEEDDPHPNCWDDGFCWASNSDEEPSDPPVGWIEMPGTADSAVSSAIERCAKVAETMGGDFIESDANGDGYREARQHIATAIRALLTARKSGGDK
jgi:hypothetical protein